jgi:hypothetical protein
VAAIALAVVLIAVLNRGHGSAGPTPINESKLIGLQTGPAPWNAGLDHLPDRMKPLGMTEIGGEGQGVVLHIHAHLDIVVNGKRKPVPASIGIFDSQFLTELHTHDASGIMHVEAPTRREFTLGEFFGVWGVRLTDRCVGGYCKPKAPWRLYVNGGAYPGNPARLTLKRHQELALVVGQPPKRIPSTYDFGGL